MEDNVIYEIESATNLKHTFYAIASKLKTEVFEKGFEFTIEIPSEIGNGRFKGYDFGEGLSLININADIYQLIQLDFDAFDRHTLRYIFLNNGDLVHILSPSFRYRLTRHTSSIAFSPEKNYTQNIFLPAQKDLFVQIFQINTEKYAANISRDCIAVPDKLAKVFMKEHEKNFFLYQSAYPIEINDTLKLLYESKAEGILKRFFLESKALELIWMQTEYYRREQLTGFEKEILRSKDIEIITKAKDYIRLNLHKDITLKTMARELGTNETKLKTGLKLIYGKTFGEILRNERLNKAKVLLESNVMSVKEVALECGYLSGSIFAKRFKERFGILPKDYMNR